MANIREILESPIAQGEDESIVYTLDTTPWGGAPTSVTAKIFSIDASTGAKTDVTSAKMPTGSPSAEGNIITIPSITGLAAGTQYRLEVKFTISGSQLEAWATIEGEV